MRIKEFMKKNVVIRLEGNDFYFYGHITEIDLDEGTIILIDSKYKAILLKVKNIVMIKEMNHKENQKFLKYRMENRI